MKKNQAHFTDAFSLTDLLVVVAVIGVMALLAISALAGTSIKSVRINCASNLRQVAMSFSVWAGGNGGKLPQAYAGSAQYPLINSANPGAGTQGAAWSQLNCPNLYTVLLSMSNELSNSKLIVCPADTADRTVPANFYPSLLTNKNRNLSYFVGENAVETLPMMFLVGDRNISQDSDTVIYTGTGLGPYGYSPPSASSLSGWIAFIGTNINRAPLNGGNFGWTQKIHQSSGNVALVDGSVKNYNQPALRTAFNLTGDTNVPTANALLFP